MILIFALKDEVEHSLFLKVLRPFCELGKYSSGYAGHLPWIVKLPRLKIGWGAKDCISHVVDISYKTYLLWVFIFCFCLHYLSSFFGVPDQSLFNSLLPPQQLKKKKESNEWTWESLIPSQYPQAHWFSKLSFGNKIKCSKTHLLLFAEVCAWRCNTNVSKITL